jgi:UDP-N-acetylmuramyl pentapeptide phosphotransferase/UDP-N-acetylglucosamine-1-phosphate transferase
MDGINGMSFLNAFCSYVTLYFVNTNLFQFTDGDLITVFILATLVFGYFNFRKEPKCFLGDVGSITIGFTIIIFTIKLFIATKNYYAFLILMVYALDGGWTIIERLFRKENIFKAHLRHLYEILVNKFNMPHLLISTIYFLFQIIINGFVYFIIKYNYKNIFGFVVFTLVLSVSYFFIKNRAYKLKAS